MKLLHQTSQQFMLSLTHRSINGLSIDGHHLLLISSDDKLPKSSHLHSDALHTLQLRSKTCWAALVTRAWRFTFCIRILFTRFWLCIGSSSPWFNVVHAPAVSWNVITCLCASSQFNNAKKINLKEMTGSKMIFH